MRIKSNALSGDMSPRRLGVFLLAALVLAAVAAAFSGVGAVVLLGLAFAGLLCWAVLQRPYLVLLFVTLLIPYEDFLLKWLPVPENIYLLLRLASEIILYILLARVIAGRLLMGYRLVKTPIDWLLAAFLASSFISIGLNHASWLAGFINIRALLRYFAVYYIVVNMELDKPQIVGLLKAIAAAGLIQGVIALVQFFGSSAVYKFFSPPTNVVIELGEIALERLQYTTKLGAVSGTIGKPAAMGLLLIVTMIVLFTLRELKRVGKWLLLAALGLIAFGIAITYKRGELMLMILALCFYLIFKLERRTRAYFVILFGLLLFSLLIVLATNLQGAGELVNPHVEQLSVAEHFSQLLTVSYWQQNLQSSRGWFIFRVGGQALKSGGLFGYSPDSNFARATLAALDVEFQRLIDFRVFEDVYWVAMLVYYGLAGIALFGMSYLVLLFKSLRLQLRSGFTGVVARAYSILGLITLPAGFLERVFELRTYSYYLWLLAGLMMTLALRSESSVGGSGSASSVAGRGSEANHGELAS